jgi:two-component system chemotaxis response regulator CheY
VRLFMGFIDKKGRPGALKGPVKALVVDDDEHIRVLCREALSAAGYTVEAAVNGMDALARLEAGGHELVITDVTMPVLDGIGLYIKALKARPHMKDRFIFMSGGAGGPEAFESLPGIGKNWIVKPFGIGELLGLIERVLEAAGPSRWSAADRRLEKRLSWKEDCYRISEDGTLSLGPFATTLDISRHGLRIRHGGGPLALDSTLRMDIGPINFRCAALVVWSSGPDTLGSISGLRLSVPTRPSAIEMAVRGNR